MEDYGLYSDAELALFMRDGDTFAFREIYERYSEHLYIFAYRKLKNEVEARDVVHDVFAWLLEKGEALKLHGSLSSYLYKSVLNRIFDIFRKKETFQRYIDQGEHYIDIESEGTDYLIRPDTVVMNYLKTTDYTFEVLLDRVKDRVADTYKISSLPTKLIIDRDGIIRFRPVQRDDYYYMKKEMEAMIGYLLHQKV